MGSMKLSVIIPVYRCRDCLWTLHERLRAVLSDLPGSTGYEIVLIEDCGGDGSWEVIEAIAHSDPNVVGLKLSRNFGQHHAISAGLDCCTGDWAVVMDCDLQDPPEDIRLLWEKAQEGFDVVNGRRHQRQDRLWKRTTSRTYHFLLEWLSGLSYDPSVANFRIVSRSVIDALKTMRESTRSFGAQTQWLGFRTAYVDISHGARFAGQSSYTFRKLVKMAFETAISYSNKPLKISVGLGLTLAFFSFVTAIFYLVRALFWRIPVEGWASLMVSLWFIGGIVIANIGIVGLYIGKIYDEVRHRPIYVVAKSLNLPQDNSA
jgi:dolichol-phosphate mannosyltransferase